MAIRRCHHSRYVVFSTEAPCSFAQHAWSLADEKYLPWVLAVIDTCASCTKSVNEGQIRQLVKILDITIPDMMAVRAMRMLRGSGIMKSASTHGVFLFHPSNCQLSDFVG